MKMDPVVHFEMPANDKKRMADFYSKVFGWHTTMLGPEMGEYVVVTTTETDPKTMRPTQPGAINGGFYQRTKEDSQNQYPSIVIAVDNLEESMKKAQEAGGIIHGKPEDIPGVGRFVSIIDTENNRISILQPSR